VSLGVTCRGSALGVGHVCRVVGVDDCVLRESLRWWLDYIACNSDHPNKICNKNSKKNIRGSMMSTGRPDHPEINPKVREEAKVGDREGLTLQRETLR
jgi:hypothetical protein